MAYDILHAVSAFLMGAFTAGALDLFLLRFVPRLK
jgi:hypothetical protein